MEVFEAFCRCLTPQFVLMDIEALQDI